MNRKKVNQRYNLLGTMNICKTNRLILREANPEDAPFFLSLMNTTGWIKHIGDRQIKTENDALKYVQNSLIRSYKTNGFGLYVIVEKKSHKAAGICGLVKRDSLPKPDLGFAVLPEFEGKGLVYESCLAILEYAVSTLEINELLAITVSENSRSIKLLKRLGFQPNEHIKPNSEEEKLLTFSNNLTTKKC